VDTNSFIEGLESQEDLTSQDRVWMFMMLIDDEAIMLSLKKQAMMLKIGMVSEDPIYGLAYAVMRLAKPHLFEREESDALPAAE